MQKFKKKQEGFTIIEVLIVLAIAGLIMLIVFLAVPALQRNSRNTQRKNDVSAIVGAINEWQNNNNGRLPATAAEQAAAISNAQLGIYNGAVQWTGGWPADANSVHVVPNWKCLGETNAQPQNRAVAVTYRVETSNGTAQQCDGS